MPDSSHGKPCAPPAPYATRNRPPSSEPFSSSAVHGRVGRLPARRTIVGTLVTTAAPATVAAQITARASGYCEVMAPACTYQQALIFLRRRRADPTRRFTSPADGIAACGNCADLIEHTDIATAKDLGYLVDPRTPTSVSAVLWRQHRWVYLDICGRVHHAAQAALSHEAC